MIRTACLGLLLLVLPSCVAAIGNRGGTFYSLPRSASPLLQEKVEAARRILELRQSKLDNLRTQFEAGRADTPAIVDAEIAVETARIQLLQFRAELQALQSEPNGNHDED